MGVPDDFETSKQEMPPDVVSKALHAAKAKGVSKMATQSGATWGIDRIDSATGNDNSYNDGGHQGANTVIYILDTGVRIDHVRAAHPRAPHGATPARPPLHPDRPLCPLCAVAVRLWRSRGGWLDGGDRGRLELGREVRAMAARHRTDQPSPRMPRVHTYTSDGRAPPALFASLLSSRPCSLRVEPMCRAVE